MELRRKYLVAVALLAVLAVVFGLAGTVAPGLDLVSPKQSSSSSSVTHFVNPPTYDSDWVDITDKRGQSFTLTHDLINIHPVPEEETLVDVVGRQSLVGGNHKLFFGTTYSVQGWNQTYGGAYSDSGYEVVQTSDGGYAIAGYTFPFDAGFADSCLIKTDSAGNMEWNKTYGGTSADMASSLVQTADGGYAMAGTTHSFGAISYNLWLVKTDSAGNMQWNKTWGGEYDEMGESLVQTVDGGYAIAGFTRSFGMGGFADFWLVKVDSSGDMEWNQTYGGPTGDYASSVVETDDGGYALAGLISTGPGDQDFWVVKTDSAGNMEWNKTYGGPDNIEDARSLVQTVDGGYAIAGGTFSWVDGDDDFWLVKTDSAGNMQWNKTYGGTLPDEAFSMVQTVDGGYALAGYTESFGPGDQDFWVVKTDSAGNMEWNKTYGGTDSDEDARSLVQTVDGGYAIAGGTFSWVDGDDDFWLVKTGDELGFSVGLSMIDFTNSNITFYRGSADLYWNYLRVRIWLIQEPTWQFGDINQDGVVDAQDLWILSRNYGTTFSLLSLTGIIAIAGIHTYKARKQPK